MRATIAKQENFLGLRTVKCHLIEDVCVFRICGGIFYAD